MMLKDKVAVIYGAGGAVGGAIAHAFAREGATLFLTGRSLEPVEIVAKEVVATGGSAEAAKVDALDEQAVDEHLKSVIDKVGRVDISFNAVGIPSNKLIGVPLVEMEAEWFVLPITTFTTSYFLTARLAARRMVANRSGVIMTVTTLQSRTGYPTAGGFGPAMAAKEALTRQLSAELAAHGIRVVGLRPQGIPETDALKDAYEPRAKSSGMTYEQFKELAASKTHTRRLSTPGVGEHGGLPGFRQRERNDGNDRQPVHGNPGRLTAERLLLEPGCASTQGDATTNLPSRDLQDR